MRCETQDLTEVRREKCCPERAEPPRRSSRASGASRGISPSRAEGRKTAMSPAEGDPSTRSPGSLAQDDAEGVVRGRVNRAPLRPRASTCRLPEARHRVSAHPPRLVDERDLTRARLTTSRQDVTDRAGEAGSRGRSAFGPAERPLRGRCRRDARTTRGAVTRASSPGVVRPSRLHAGRETPHS